MKTFFDSSSHVNNVGGISRSNTLRNSIRIAPPIVPSQTAPPSDHHLRQHHVIVHHHMNNNQTTRASINQNEISNGYSNVSHNHNHDFNGHLNHESNNHFYYDPNNCNKQTTPLSHSVVKCHSDEEHQDVSASALQSHSSFKNSSHQQSQSQPMIKSFTGTTINMPNNIYSNCNYDCNASSKMNNVSCSEQSENHATSSSSAVSSFDGRVSPSSGSSNDSRKSRYSNGSLDSGRGSDNAKIPHLKRISVHSCDSIGSTSSQKDISTRNSSSSSSIGSGISSAIEPDCNSSNNSNSNSTNTIINHSPTKTTTTSNNRLSNVSNLSNAATNNGVNGNTGHPQIQHLTIAEMILNGFADHEIIKAWLTHINFEEYVACFIQTGYDMPTISRMTPEDLTAIGITKPSHRRILKQEIQRLNIVDGIPQFKPNSLLEWLKLLRLEEYFSVFNKQGYETIDKVAELTWEDFEDVGIKKLGHQKKLILAIKKIQTLSSEQNNYTSNASNDSANATYVSYNRFQNQPVGINSSSSASHISRPISSANVYQLPIHPHCQDVPIKTSYPNQQSSPETPNAPQMKTFQQQQFPVQNQSHYNHNTNFTRQQSEHLVRNNASLYYPELINTTVSNALIHPAVQQLQPTRGRSLESLEYMNSDVCYRQLSDMSHQRNSFNPSHNYMMTPATPKVKRDHSFAATPKENGISHYGYDTDSEVSVGCNYEDFNYQYEYDGTSTATLNRPKNLLKNRPIAKIAAKTRQDSIKFGLGCSQSTENIMLGAQKSVNMNHSTDKMHNSLNNSNFALRCEQLTNSLSEFDLETPPTPTQIYATLKRTRKTPPPVPKRSNSITKECFNRAPYNPNVHQNQNDSVSDNHNHNHSHRESIEEMQDQAFATCVKSLTSRFSMMGHTSPIIMNSHVNVSPKMSPMSHSKSLLPSSDEMNDFPPPPSPLLCNDYVSAKEHSTSSGPSMNHKEYMMCDREANISSSSSTESMPFANENIGTIRFKEGSAHSSMNHFSAPTSPDEFEYDMLNKKMNPHHNLNSPNIEPKKFVNNFLPRKPSGITIANHTEVKNGHTNNLQQSQTQLQPQPIDCANVSGHMNGQINNSEQNLDEIETMLVNLSNQLDLMLASERKGQ